MKVLGLFLVACLLCGIVTAQSANENSKAALNVALGRKVMTDIYGQGRIDLVDGLYADDFVDDSPGGGTGRALIKQAVSGFHSAFPDLRLDIEDAFAADDKVIVRYTAHGTQTGPFNGIPPTGKTGAVRGITIFLIKDGKIKTEWTEYDRLGLLRQLGVLPS